MFGCPGIIVEFEQRVSEMTDAARDAEVRNNNEKKVSSTSRHFRMKEARYLMYIDLCYTMFAGAEVSTAEDGAGPAGVQGSRS